MVPSGATVPRLVRRPTYARLLAVLKNRLLTAPDTWERHLIVADLLGSPSEVVDVGGLPRQLAGFLPDSRVLAVNVHEPADLIVPLDSLPFADGAFEAATSLDVLEHVNPAARADFIAEFVRVARRRSVLCCPLGTPQHRAAEEEVQSWYRSITGEDHPWLVEHLVNGLPRLDELRDAYARLPGRTRFLFHGDFRKVNQQFRRIVLARYRHRPGDVASYLGSRVRYRPVRVLTPEPERHSNRVFAVHDGKDS